VNYAISAGTVTFGRGEFLKMISIPTIDDGVYSPDLSFNVEFVPHGTTLSRGDTLPMTITNIDPEPVVSIGDITAEEQSETAVFLVTLSRASASPVGFRYATSDGTATAPLDYIATSGILIFAPGETSKTVTVPVVRDQIADPGETFTLRLTDGFGATIRSAVATILESDRLPQPLVLVDDISVAEGNSGTTDATFNVRLSFASTLPVVVAWRTENGTARDDSDYTAGIGTLTFAPGETSLPVTVKISGDTTIEPNETFRIAIIGTSNAIAGSGASCTIINDDGAAPLPRRRAVH
jgi:chitinase